MPMPESGSEALEAWILTYVRQCVWPVSTISLSLPATRLGWPRYAVHTAMSTLYRQGLLRRHSPGFYSASVQGEDGKDA
jgi:DNA-binding IclR family transcriptional regulator